MAESLHRGAELAALLNHCRLEIAAAWVETVSRASGLHYRGMSSGDLRDSALGDLAAVEEAVATGTDAALEGYLSDLAIRRMRQGFDIGEVIEGLLLLRDSALPFLWNHYPPTEMDWYETVAVFDACVRHMLARVARLYEGATHRGLLEQHERADLLLRVVQTASGSLELDQVLARVAEGMVTAVGVGYCGIYLSDSEKGVLVPHAAAGDMASIQMDLFRTYSLDPEQDPLFAEVLEHAEPLVYQHEQNNRRVSPETVRAFGLKSVLVVPIEVGGRVLGVALVVTFRQHHVFSNEEILLARGVADATALAIENARLYEETRRRLAESQGLQRVAAALLEKMDLGEVLDIVCTEARELTGAAGSAVFLLEDVGWLRVARSTGTSWPTYDRLPMDRSFTGTVVRTGMARFTNAPATEPERFRGDIVPTALLAVPLVVKGVAIGALDVVYKAGGFTGEDLRVMGLFADQAAIAIENARLRRQVEQLAVVEERQRLAHELHDSVTQSLYSMSLFAEAAGGLIASNNGEKALEHLRQLRETAHEALREMRLLIFELHPPVLENEGLVAALQTRLDSVESRGGLQCKLLVEGDERYPIAVEEDLYRIALEALNNVLKHARAQKVTVQLKMSDGRAWLEVADDGDGFEIQSSRVRGGLGLSGMEERARRIGALFAVESAPGKGTRVTVDLRTGQAIPGDPKWGTQK
jgi:signal transduction histidine kinase